MLIHELSPKECAALLQRVHVGRLACASHDQPYIVPVQFSFDPDRGCLYSFATLGQKIRWMRTNPLVCVEIDEIVDKDHWQTVVLFGKYEEIRTQHDRADAERRAQAAFEQRQEWWLPGAARLQSGDPEPPVLYRIRIERMTGRRAARNVLASSD
jgi:uncharacterized protein